MAERKPPEFRFDADDQEPDEIYHEEMKDLRVEKLNQRITLITILLPCLVAVAIYFGYRDLTSRLHQSRDSGNLEVEKLSTQMEELSKKFNEKLVTFSTTLSAQDQDFGNSISGKLNAMNKNIEVLNQSMKSFNENLNQTKSAIGKLDKSKAEIKSLQSQFTQEMTKVDANAATLKKEYDLLQESIARQLSEKIDKTALGVELLMFKKNQSIHSQEITRLAQKLDSIQKGIEDLQIDSKLNRQPEESISKKLPLTPSTMTESTGSIDNKSPSALEDVKVREQDLPPE